MKLVLLKNIGEYGMLLEYNRVLQDFNNIEIPEEGSLIVGKRSYTVQYGRVVLPIYEIMEGPNKVIFTSQEGVNYFCGVIHRSNRFLNISNPVEALVVNLALTIERQGQEIKRLDEEIDTIKEQYGISII